MLERKAINPFLNSDRQLRSGWWILIFFLALMLFGLAFLRTRSLAMPLGMHFMENWVQGGFLGFGASGEEQSGLLISVIRQGYNWLTGGSFGLEASLPGLVCVLVALVFLYTMKKK